MSSKVQIKLVYSAVALGLLLAFLAGPMPPTLQGDCSLQTATCTG